MHVGTRIKGGFGDNGHSYKTGNIAEFVTLNNCSFFNTDPMFIS